MKDVYQIFDENLNTMKQFVEEYKFANCTKIASELIRIASFSDFKDGIMISEMLEAIFSQLTPLFLNYNISDVEIKSIRIELIKQIDLLSKSYKNTDLSKIYQILRDARVLVTQFQFKCWDLMEEKLQPDTKRFARG